MIGREHSGYWPVKSTATSIPNTQVKLFMLNNPNQSDLQLSWQALLWRILLTLALLLALAGPGLSIFGSTTARSDSSAAPRPPSLELIR